MTQNYKYNGKKYNDAFGLNIYEMDWQQYDPAISRWTVMDPVTHHDFSPYSAFDNNPAFWSDPSGANSVKYNWGSGGYDVLGKDGKVVGSFDPGMLGNYLPAIVESINLFFSLNPNDDENSGGGNGSFSTGDLFALAAKNGVTSKTEAGLAFEKAVLEYLGLTSNKEKFKSKARMIKTDGKYSSVIPDAVSNINVYSLFGSGYYPNSHFHEIKAVTGWLNLISGSSDYQVLGLIDAIATSTLGGKDGRSILTFYTTSNTSISPDVIQYANQKNVTLKWSIAYMNNNLLYFTPPVTLSYSAQRQTIKIPIGVPQFQGVQIKF